MAGNQRASAPAAEAALAAIEQCFDPRLAEAPTRLVPLARVIDLLVVSHAPERVREYRVAMQRGERFPPIAVVQAAGRYWVADGHKRLTAFQQASDGGQILVQVWGWRRWLADQAGQLRRSLGRLAGSARRGARVPGDRHQVGGELSTVLAHWQRIVRSLAVHLRRALFGRGDSETGRGTLVRLLRECARDPLPLAIAIVSLVLAAAAQLSLTWVVKLWIEGPVLARNAADLPVVVTATAACALLLVVTLFTSKYMLARVSQGLLARLREQMQARYLALAVASARERPSGERVARVLADAGQLAVFMRDGLHRLVGESLVVAGAVAAMFYLEWRLALAVVVFGPPVALLLARVGRRIRRRASAANAALATLGATLTEQLHGLGTIKVFQAEDHERERFARVSAVHRRAAVRADVWSALLVTGVWLLTGVVLLAAMAIGTDGVIAGRLSPATLGVFCLYAAQTVEPLRRLSELHALLQRMLAAAERVYEAIDEPPIEARGGAALAAPVHGALRFAGVRFAYRPGQPVLDGLDLDIAAGEAVTVVGASGAGKSTLAHLLVRFAQPQAGAIRLDGQDLALLDLRDLRRAVCLVEQEPMVFAGALRDNLRYGSWQASTAALDAAIDLVGMRALVEALPGGLDGELAELGRDLSGGQRQRIALARAIVRDPAVLVLDEATSALDGEAEARLFERLGEWLSRRTVLTVAHRLSTVSRFPRVVVLDAGRVVGDGSVTDLARDCVAFQRLFAEQLDAARGVVRPAAAAPVRSVGALPGGG